MSNVASLTDQVANMTKELERQTQGWHRMWQDKCDELDRCEARERGRQQKAKRALALGIERSDQV